MFEIYVDDELIAKTYDYDLAFEYVYTTIRNFCSGIGETNREYSIKIWKKVFDVDENSIVLDI